MLRADNDLLFSAFASDPQGIDVTLNSIEGTVNPLPFFPPTPILFLIHPIPGIITGTFVFALRKWARD